MSRFIVHHHHSERECRAAFAAWRGFRSPLRGLTTPASCSFGGHEMWWDVDATTEEEALALLPGYVAARASAVRVEEVAIP